MRTKRKASNIYHCFVTTTISGVAGGCGGMCGRPEWHIPRGRGGRMNTLNKKNQRLTNFKLCAK